MTNEFVSFPALEVDNNYTAAHNVLRDRMVASKTIDALRAASISGARRRDRADSEWIRNTLTPLWAGWPPATESAVVKIWPVQTHLITWEDDQNQAGGPMGVAV
jgi:hypothetical protein